jgi:hypothetical protein
MAVNNYLSICAQNIHKFRHKFESWLFPLINPLIVLSFLVAALNIAERVIEKFTSQFFRITSYCFLNHQHPDERSVCCGRVKINTESVTNCTLFIYWKDFKNLLFRPNHGFDNDNKFSRMNRNRLCRHKLELCKDNNSGSY